MPAVQSCVNIHVVHMPDFNFKPKDGPEDFGWYDRGYLPHFDAGETAQFVTFRLADSMPQKLLDEWRTEAKTDAEFRKRIEKYLDAGYGECWLRDERVATMVQRAFVHYHGDKYTLHAWVVMPNHAHILFTPLVNEHLPKIMHSIKSYTANEANKLLGRKGLFWQRESFDRYIRNATHFSAVIRYIENNPVTAGLCKTREQWQFSSAYNK
jgi:REP element-mobilizing transposase RayT